MSQTFRVFCVLLATLVVSFGMFPPCVSAQTDLLFEDFDGLFDILEPAEDEGIDPSILGWTHEPPEGWEILNISFVTGEELPGIGDPNEGVTEWEGWSFTTAEFWQAADGQRRDEFTLAEGVFAVADPDEWDDLGDPEALGTRPCDVCGPYNTALNTPDIDIAGVVPGTLRLEFDSSWRPEFDSSNQGAILTAIFDTGVQQELFRWTSDPGSPNFKDDNSTNEHLSYDVDAPADANTVSFLFQMVDAGNDWWWAIDNVVVSGDVDGGPGVPCDFDADTDCDVDDIDLLNQEIVAGTDDAAFDMTGDGAVNLADQERWRADAATENGFAGPYLIGDANLDGNVNAADLNAVGRNWQQASSLWSEGDFDASGFVEAGDLNGLGINWQMRTPEAAANEAVPEPAGLLLLILGTIACLLRRR